MLVASSLPQIVPAISLFILLYIKSLSLIKESETTDYTDLEKIRLEVENAKKTFKKYNWPSIDITRKSVEETAASVIKIHEIFKKNA